MQAFLPSASGRIGEMQTTPQKTKERKVPLLNLNKKPVPTLNLNNLMNVPARGTPRVVDMVDRLENLESARSHKAEQISIETARMAPVADMVDRIEKRGSVRSNKAEQFSIETARMEEQFSARMTPRILDQVEKIESARSHKAEHFSLETARMSERSHKAGRFSLETARMSARSHKAEHLSLDTARMEEQFFPRMTPRILDQVEKIESARSHKGEHVSLDTARMEEQFFPRMTPRILDRVEKIERIFDQVEKIEAGRSPKSEHLSEVSEEPNTNQSAGSASSRTSSCRNGRFGSQAPHASLNQYCIGTPRPRARTSSFENSSPNEADEQGLSPLESDDESDDDASSMSDGQAHDDEQALIPLASEACLGTPRPGLRTSSMSDRHAHEADEQELSPVESDDESDDESNDEGDDESDDEGQALLVPVVKQSVEKAHEVLCRHESDVVDQELNPVLEKLDYLKQELEQYLEESEEELCTTQSSSSSSPLNTSRTQSDLDGIDSCEVLRKIEVLAKEMEQSNDDTASVVAQQSLQDENAELRLQIMLLQKENAELKKQQQPKQLVQSSFENDCEGSSFHSDEGSDFESSGEESDVQDDAATEKKEAETKDAAEKNAVNKLNKQFVVQSRVLKGIVFYDVYCGQGNSGFLKSTRYSELSRFHEDVMREVPEFQGQLPRKTFLRHTNTDFVESRRVDLQAYLRAMAMDSRVSQSQVYEDFFQAQEKHDLAAEDGTQLKR